MAAEALLISKGKVVTLNYVLTNDQGEELDRADGNEPFIYLHGSHQIIPGLEVALEGSSVGKNLKVTVAPKDAYGEVDPSLRLQVERAKFPEPAALKVGMAFETEADDGEAILFRIVQVGLESVEIDGNHPLAGQTLHFDVKVEDVREATADELNHGHAHGPDGHHHH